MEPTAKLPPNSHSQDADNGDVSLVGRPTTWDTFFAALATANVPADFLSRAERHHDLHSPGDCDLLEG